MSQEFSGSVTSPGALGLISNRREREREIRGCAISVCATPHALLLAASRGHRHLFQVPLHGNLSVTTLAMFTEHKCCGNRPRQSQSCRLFPGGVRSVTTKGLVKGYCVLWMNNFILLCPISLLITTKNAIIIGCQHWEGILKILFLGWGSTHDNGHMNI